MDTGFPDEFLRYMGVDMVESSVCMIERSFQTTLI